MKKLVLLLLLILLTTTQANAEYSAKMPCWYVVMFRDGSVQKVLLIPFKYYDTKLESWYLNLSQKPTRLEVHTLQLSPQAAIEKSNTIRKDLISKNKWKK